jgi:hypothetical protein
MAAGTWNSQPWPIGRIHETGIEKCRNQHHRNLFVSGLSLGILLHRYTINDLLEGYKEWR